ncbi:MAG: hypothetical protein V1822_01340 [Candidatus Micrarchaeota archaeon]
MRRIINFFKTHHWAAGLAGLLFLPIFYYSIMSLLGSANLIPYMLARTWPYLALMSAGLGIQGYLISYLTSRLSAGAVATSGGFSATAMAACCAHHASDLLAIAGASTLAAFADKYQEVFLLFGVFSNMAGIAYMLSCVQTRNLHPNAGPLSFLFAINWKSALIPLIAGLFGIWAAFALHTMASG